MGVAEDAYDVLFAIAIIHAVVTNLIASIPYAELKKPQERLWYSDGPPLSFLPLPTPDPLSHIAIRLVKNAKASVRATTFSPTQLEELAMNGDVVPSS